MLLEEQFERISKGVTIKSKTQDHIFYTIINVDEDRKIIEVFIRLDDPEQFEMIQMVSMLISAFFKAEIEPIEIAKALKKVYSPITKHIIPGTSTMCPSIVARIGYILEEFIEDLKNDNVRLE